jgi:hypothetical protein
MENASCNAQVAKRIVLELGLYEMAAQGVAFDFLAQDFDCDAAWKRAVAQVTGVIGEASWQSAVARRASGQLTHSQFYLLVSKLLRRHFDEMLQSNYLH